MEVKKEVAVKKKRPNEAKEIRMISKETKKQRNSWIEKTNKSKGNKDE